MIRSYMVKGIGNVVAEVANVGKKGVMVDYPALAMPMATPDGRSAWMLDSLVPSYLDNPGSIARKLKIPHADILFSSRVDSQMEKMYSSFKAAAVKKFSGLVLPE